MALFGFGDISFDKSNGERGPLGALVGNQFQKTTLKYPIDLGNTDKAHYLVIYIRKQEKSSFGDAAGATLPGGTKTLNQASAIQQAAAKSQTMGSIEIGRAHV